MLPILHLVRYTTKALVARPNLWLDKATLRVFYNILQQSVEGFAYLQEICLYMGIIVELMLVHIGSLLKLPTS